MAKLRYLSKLYQLHGTEVNLEWHCDFSESSVYAYSDSLNSALRIWHKKLPKKYIKSTEEEVSQYWDVQYAKVKKLLQSSLSSNKDKIKYTFDWHDTDSPNPLFGKPVAQKKYDLHFNATFSVIQCHIYSLGETRFSTNEELEAFFELGIDEIKSRLKRLVKNKEIGKVAYIYLNGAPEESDIFPKKMH